MNTLRIYSAFLIDGEEEHMLQPYISTDDDSAVNTVKYAIREDKTILSLAMAERINLKWICDVNPDNGSVINESSLMYQIYSPSYFRKYAQTVYADEARQKANEMEATNDD